MGHDTIVIGGSDNGVESLRELVSALSVDLPAAVFAVIHIPPYATSYLPEILSRAGPLPAVHPRDREAIRPGMVYIAPPDFHLLVGSDFVRVVKGPRENNMRPAIDPLFRTAAVAHGPGVIGVILSGRLDDGTTGLRAIKACGGLSVVQDPADATYPDMPASALADAVVDHCLPLAQIGPALDRLSRLPVVEPKRAAAVPDELKSQAAMAEWDLEALQSEHCARVPSPFMCPNCKGDLGQVREGDQFRFHGAAGHDSSPLNLPAGESEAIDTTLNEAFCALKEKLHLTERLARKARASGREGAAQHYENEAKTLNRSARTIWDILHGAGPS
jgi:two-component system chemotaxis response regulator CheB